MRIYPRMALSITLAVAAQTVCSSFGVSLEENAQVWYSAHEAEVDACNALATSGDSNGGSKRLVALAEKDGGPVAAFVVANLLYKTNSDASYRLHAKTLSA